MYIQIYFMFMATLDHDHPVPFRPFLHPSSRPLIQAIRGLQESDSKRVFWMGPPSDSVPSGLMFVAYI